jgi:metal-dependent amidase/aminoacylase/carboxypeptidase family protein
MILGARAMVDDGLWTKHGLPKPDYFIGMHTAPGPVGLAVSEQLIEGVRNISNGIARTYGMPEDEMPVITMKGSSTPLVNDGELAARLAVPLKALLGDKNVVTALPPSTGSEDVHLLLGPHTDVPFTFLIVGVADPAVFAAARREARNASRDRGVPGTASGRTADPRRHDDRQRAAGRASPDARALDRSLPGQVGTDQVGGLLQLLGRYLNPPSTLCVGTWIG